ncbi:MAG: hypothetical protein ACI8ZN_001142 [Bacteroidia bacterium]|jgi:hypothetical protein
MDVSPSFFGKINHRVLDNLPSLLIGRVWPRKAGDYKKGVPLFKGIASNDGTSQSKDFCKRKR